ERRSGVVDTAVVHRGRSGHVARVVRHADAQVIEPVGGAGRVPRGGDVRPRASAGRGALVGDRRHSRAGVAGRGGEVDGAAQVRAGVVHGRGRVRVVDEPILDDGRRRRVARVV